VVDTLERWARGGIGSDNIANGSITTAEVANGTFLELAVGGTARKVAFGSGSVGWGTGNDFSQVATISHGLGATPLCVSAVFSQSTGVTKYPAIQVFNVGSSTFQISFNTTDGQVPAGGSTTGYYWLAIR
jgi:hypothetical protein